MIVVPERVAPKMGKNIVTYRNVSKVYQTRRGKEIQQALDRVNFDVEENEFVSVVGPSGCGKTTLLKVTCGLLPYEGEI
jgi:NitT/TauT family transport system ATP-binding protein